jgi:hypothetical protein
VGGGVGGEEDCTVGAAIGEVSLVPKWERDATVEVEMGAFDVEDGHVRRRQRRWECGGGFSARSRSRINNERSLRRCYNGIQEKPSVNIYLEESQFLESYNSR